MSKAAYVCHATLNNGLRVGAKSPFSQLIRVDRLRRYDVRKSTCYLAVAGNISDDLLPMFGL